MLIPYIALSIMAVLFGLFVIGFVVASIWDLVTARKRKNDLFYVLRKDFDDTKRPARK